MASATATTLKGRRARSGDQGSAKHLCQWTLQPIAAWHVPKSSVANDAVVENGRVVGAHPDSRVRFQIRRDYNWYRLDCYTELTYQPMQEVMSYLRANAYKTYIVTGFGQDFVRVYSQQIYGILPEQVIGSALAAIWLP
jgi:hypothetical protein